MRTIADVMIRSVQASLRAMNHLLSRTVMTARAMVTIVIHATRFTIGPLCVDEICGTRATNIAKSAAAIECGRGVRIGCRFTAYTQKR